jgi:hypothetical protein
MDQQVKQEISQDIIDMYGPRLCFTTPDGFMVCNYVIRYGKVVQSKSGGWLRFWPGWRRKSKSEKIKKATDLPFEKEVFVDRKIAIK